MPVGTKKLTPYVQVPELKQPNMCGLCGKCGQRWKEADLPYNTKLKMESYCEVTGKSIRGSAGCCAGPFVMEHRVREYIRKYGTGE